MDPVLDPTDFARFARANADLAVIVADAGRRGALAGILEEVAALVRAGDARALLGAAPRVIGTAMQRYGWQWNGFYVRRDDALHLGPAFGPPVCTPLARKGGLFTSGMCWDAILLNQTLASFDVTRWPGYVSCDGESGLGTRASIVCPLRDGAGAPFAVWDLDATAAIEPGDVRFCDVLFATLARFLSLTLADFQ